MPFPSACLPHVQQHVRRFLALSAAALALSLPAIAAAQNKGPLKIGVSGPYTGPMAAYGEQAWAGAKTYIDAVVNPQGGIGGRTVELVKGDDACEAKQGVAVANRFVDQDKVVAVVGPLCSSVGLPASNVFNDAGVLMMAYAVTNPQFTERGLDNVFRNVGRDDQQAVVAVDFLLNDLKKKKIALIHDKDAYGKGLVDALKKLLEARGVQPVLYEGLSKGERDFNALVTKVRSAGADAVYFGGLIPEGGPLIRQIREQGLNVDIISGDSFDQDALLAAAGGAANLKGVYYSAVGDLLADPTTRPMQEVLTKAGVKLDAYTLYGYAATQAVVAALGEGRDADLEQQIDWLRNNTLETAIGKIGWDKKGDLVGFKFVFYQFDDSGKPVAWKR